MVESFVFGFIALLMLGAVALSVFAYTQSGKKSRSALMTYLERRREMPIGCAVSILLVLLVVGAGQAFVSIDASGWFPHYLDTPILMGRSEWLIGEYRRCTATPDGKGSITELECYIDTSGASPDLTSRELPVKYWGRIERPDAERKVEREPTWPWTWRCQRKAESFACWAVN